MLTYIILTLSAFLLLIVYIAAETAFRYSHLYREEPSSNDTSVEHILKGFYKHADRFMQVTRLAMSLLYAAVLLGLYFILSEWFSELPTGILMLVPCAFGLIFVQIAFYLGRRKPDATLYMLTYPLTIAHLFFAQIGHVVRLLSRPFAKMQPLESNNIQAGLLGGRAIQNTTRPALQSLESTMRENDVKIFRKALEFSKVRVKDCIVPRTEIRAIEMDESYNELIDSFVHSGKTKIVVYEEDLDHIVGYIHSSDLFALPAKSQWTDCVREIPIVPEAMNAQRMMQIFMQQKKSIAWVVDEFGGTSGIISLEDLVEEIFGDIEDEHDMETLTARLIGEQEYLLSARMEIAKVNENFNLALPESDDYQTVGGLILHHYQDFPKVGQLVAIGAFKFRILKTSKAKIDLVKLTLQDNSN